jgi:hypothetical protein
VSSGTLMPPASTISEGTPVDDVTSAWLGGSSFVSHRLRLFRGASTGSASAAAGAAAGGADGSAAAAMVAPSTVAGAPHLTTKSAVRSVRAAQAASHMHSRKRKHDRPAAKPYSAWGEQSGWGWRSRLFRFLLRPLPSSVAAVPLAGCS